MHWLLDKNRQICSQLCGQLCVKIAAEIYQPDDKVPSVGEIAVAAGVTPYTKTKAKVANLPDNIYLKGGCTFSKL